MKAVRELSLAVFLESAQRLIRLAMMRQYLDWQRRHYARFENHSFPDNHPCAALGKWRRNFPNQLTYSYNCSYRLPRSCNDQAQRHC